MFVKGLEAASSKRETGPEKFRQPSSCLRAKNLQELHKTKTTSTSTGLGRKRILIKGDRKVDMTKSICTEVAEVSPGMVSVF